MSVCPNPDDLDRWMREGVDPTTAAHVEGCETCKLRVMKLRTTMSGPARKTQTPLNPFADAERTIQGAPYVEEQVDLQSTALKPTTPRNITAEGYQPGDLLGRFVVLGRLGEGGMGVVYAAYDPELDRKVAIKLLRSDVAGAKAEDMRNRLLREAQAMARLSHPNVIPVYDVGTVDGQVFVAMEFIEGKTLSAHLRGAPGWKQAVTLHVLAGKGLAAAHAAGLIHRDFKPQNVLVSKDGDVRVLDFGLARPAGQSEPPQVPVPPSAAVPVGSRSPSGRPLLDTPMTQSGIMMGTPAYMSPEQLSAGIVDARTDQFAFCVSLFESLYGLRPFTGETVLALSEAIRDGRITARPKGSKVPSRFYKLITRGLAADPAKRWVSLEQLLKELQRDPAQTTRRALASVLVLGVAGAAVAGSVWTSRQQRLLCTGAEAKLKGAWDPDRKEALLRAFVGTGAPYAPEVFATATRLLDAYTSSWVAMRTDACEATRLRGEQSERLLDLRIQCLDRKLGEVGALLALFAAADAKVVDRAVPAVQSLGGLSECADARALNAEGPVLSDAAKSDLSAAYAKLADAKAASQARAPADALALATEAQGLAVKSGQLQAVAETRLQVADLKGKLADDRGAVDELLNAAIAADGAKRDDLRARALTELSLEVFKLGRPDESLSWGQLANAALARSGGDDAVQARLHHILALVFHQLGRPDEAQAHFGKCLDLRKKAFGADSYVAAAAMQAFGKTLHEEGKLDEAVQHLRNAVALQEKALGSKHPDVAVARQALGAALAAKKDWKAAEAEQRAALAGLTDGLLVGAAHADLSRTLRGAGDARGAVAEAEAALTAYSAALPAKHPSIAQAYVELGELQEKKAALATARKASALLDVDASPPGLVARAALLEAKSMPVKKAAVAKVKPVLQKLQARAPKEPAVQALADWLH